MSQIEVSNSNIIARADTPEPGQLVEVRRRQWVVSDVQATSLAIDSPSLRQHLVSLASIDEDSLGEALEVLWEIEPGARVLEKAGLPRITGHDDAGNLEAFLDAVRWGAPINAHRSFLQAPFRSGITIEDFQLDPVVRAIEMARVNLLIADDVGLGKTIEAGLVIQELLIRHRARTILIVVPASLQIKWQTEMQEKFGLEFKIVDTEYVKVLRRERGIHANPWTSFPRLITSMDWMKSGAPLRSLKDILPPHITYPRKFDILVVDEAHNVAPAAASRYSIESQRTRLIRLLSPHFEHRLFLTATPHNGYEESFTSLLELLDNQRFARTVMPDQRQLQRVMVRRLKNEIVDSYGKPVYPKRELKTLEIDYSEEEREIHALLKEYSESRSTAVKGTKFQFGTEFVHKLLKKRLFSSPQAFAVTLSRHRDTLFGNKNEKADSELEDRILRKAILKTEEDYADDVGLEDAIEEATVEATKISAALTQDQRKLLDRLIQWAEKAKNKPDSKAQALLAWLDANLRPNGKWNDNRVILFTEYRATHSWLHRILASHKYAGERLEILHGGMDLNDRERVKAAFQANPKVSPVRILLATDAASEGIDLQNHCNFLIHIEIPWNPNVMEQRNGRIDRHGQRGLGRIPGDTDPEPKVYVWHPVGKNALTEDGRLRVGSLDGDLEYLMRASVKVNTIRRDLGSVGMVIAKQIEEAMLGQRGLLDTREAEEKAERIRRKLPSEAKLKERVAKLHEKLLEAKNDFYLSPTRIKRAVQVGMDLAGLPPLVPVSLSGLPDDSAFQVPILPGSWGRATIGLEHPHTRERRPITFDPDLVKNRDDVVLAHLNHKLVQMCLRLLRAEVWALEDLKKLHRISVRAIHEGEISNPVAIVLSRLVITGGGHHRLHEELTLAGGEIKHDSFSRIVQIGQLTKLVDSGKPIKPNPSLFDSLRSRFEKHEGSIHSAIEARSKDRLQHLSNTLERRRDAEIADLSSVLDELEKAIRGELDREEPVQLSLLPEEQNQLKKDVASLRARLERIPQERADEVAAIKMRYTGLSDRTFPVAVIFLVPQSLAGGQT